MQDSNGQNLTYDYAKLDEYLSKMTTPQELNELFQLLHCEFTRTLIIAYNEDAGPSGKSIRDELLGLNYLCDFFKILSEMNEGGES